MSTNLSAFPFDKKKDTLGATLRDYFAAHALNSPLIIPELLPAEVARLCYELADALLAERAK